MTMTMTFFPGLFYFVQILPIGLSSGGRLKDCFTARVQSLLAIVMLVSFLCAAFLNPGIVPRNDRIPRELDKRKDDIRNLPLPRYLRINGITIKQKFCMTCKVFRPPRSKHCSYCDNCVLRFDHHCAWLGNCIGLHNYRFFVCLIYSATIFLAQTIYMIAWVFREGAHNTFGKHPTIGDWLAAIWLEKTQVALIIYCLFLLAAVLLLSVYHTIIVLQNLTTNEHVKNYYRDNPFDFGPVLNCRQIFCHPELVVAAGEDRIEADYNQGSYYEDMTDESGF